MVSHKFKSKIQTPFCGKYGHDRSGFCILFIPFSPQSLSPVILTLPVCLAHSRLVLLPPGFSLTILSVREILPECSLGLCQSQLKLHLLEMYSLVSFSPPQSLPLASYLLLLLSEFICYFLFVYLLFPYSRMLVP